MRARLGAAVALATALACVAQVGAVGGAPQRGTKGPDRVHLGKADDRYAALHGDDHVWGARGDDRLDGGPGDDRLVGGRGLDSLRGGRGFDVCIADAGDVDRVRGCEVVRPVLDQDDGDEPAQPIDSDEPIDPPADPDNPASAPEPVYSDAYRNRNWTPTPYDTCPKALHDSYSVIGPDGKVYPAWHPPTLINPATGERCSFGHEHGANPRGSDLYDWVVSELGGIPFGYASEQLATYAAEHPGTPTRFEDHVGHKIEYANDVTLLDEDGRYVTAPDPQGGGSIRVVCDYLTKVHQGSHSADATTNNAHELLYAVRCNDGTELLSTTLARFGDANEFNRSCAPATTVDAGSSSPLPDGTGGERLIADRGCIEQFVLVPPSSQSDIWSLYENWESDSVLKTTAGDAIAAFDPWFAVRNPSRYYNAAGAIGRTLDAAWETDSTDGGVANRPPWTDVGALAPFEFRDPRSPFDGAQRELYLGATELTNAAGPTRWYTDPWGENGSTEPFPGAICQIVSSTDNSSYPPLKRRLFGRDDDYGSSNGVHAPN